ncbi:MAG: hypothetical protein RL193_787 [Actinomycetota bacterium]|jgi:uncharacterized membrane protein YczE
MSNGNWFINFLRPHRTIPITPWTGNGRWDLAPKRVAILIFGLTIFGLGDALIINSLTGNAPWSVLAQGFSLKTGVNLGTATFLISALVLFFWWPLGERPGFGTVANIVVIAIAIQFGVSNFPEAGNFTIGIIYDFLGVALVGVGSALYITCGLGPGPRDGLMTSLHKISGIRVGRIRLAIESCAFLGGFALGGRVGIGTAIFALFIGQSIAISLGVVSRLTAK